MKRYIFPGLLTLLLCISVSAQKPVKPTLTASQPTEAQRATIQEGASLHDAKRYEEALAKYQQVLKENPDCTIAMYEMAMTLSAKGDSDKALAVAFNGLKYKSSETALFYLIIANAWDDEGKSDDAIKLYNDGIKILSKESGMEAQTASLYYNLGIAYFRQKKYVDAREAAKHAVELNFSYPSPSYLLGEIFAGTKYKVPAMLAAARLISLELNSQRTARSVRIFTDPILGTKKDDKGNVTILMDMNAPKDEGDFGMYDLLLGTMMTVSGDKDEDKNKTTEEKFASAVNTFIALLVEDKKLSSTFVGKNYIPFMAEMKAKGYADVFAYLVLQQSGNENARQWLLQRKEKLAEFLIWSKAYAPPK